jgi:putative PIN family toxin of toxin-antitoxin system
MSKPRVLLDANILISGLVFSGGKEHSVLKMARDGQIILIVPEFVAWETRRILRDKFRNNQHLLDQYLSHVDYEFISWGSMVGFLGEYSGVLRDMDDNPILASFLAVNPDFVLTGDRDLREDLNKYLGTNRAVTSSEFLEMYEGSD